VLAIQLELFDPNLRIDVTHPGVITPDSNFTISTVVMAKNPDIVNITMSLEPPPNFTIIGENSVFAPALKQESTLGHTFEVAAKKDITEGAYSFNLAVNYEHKEILGDYSKQSFSKAVVVEVRFSPEIRYSITAPDSLFAGDSFPVTVTLHNTGMHANDVIVTIVPPDDLTLVGQNKHSLSKLDYGEKFGFEFKLAVSNQVDEAGERLLQIRTSYLDEEDGKHESTETFPLFVRPRGFLEIGAAGGFWLGPVFISFITGIGSIVSAAVGFVILVYRIKQGRTKANRKGKKSRPSQ
jgi:hypothetical protein